MGLVLVVREVYKVSENAQEDWEKSDRNFGDHPASKLIRALAPFSLTPPRILEDKGYGVSSGRQQFNIPNCGIVEFDVYRREASHKNKAEMAAHTISFSYLQNVDFPNIVQVRNVFRDSGFEEVSRVKPYNFSIR